MFQLIVSLSTSQEQVCEPPNYPFGQAAETRPHNILYITLLCGLELDIHHHKAFHISKFDGTNAKNVFKPYKTILKAVKALKDGYQKAYQQDFPTNSL